MYGLITPYKLSIVHILSSLSIRLYVSKRKSLTGITLGMYAEGQLILYHEKRVKMLPDDSRPSTSKESLESDCEVTIFFLLGLCMSFIRNLL